MSLQTGSDKFEFGDENMYVGGLPASFTLVPGSQQTSGLSAFEGCVFSVSFEFQSSVNCFCLSGWLAGCLHICFSVL